MSTKRQLVAMDVIEGAATDQLLRLLRALAIKNPAAVLRAAEIIGLDLWREEARELLLAGKKIEAIKLWRNKTGASLKASKEAVEALR